MNVLLIVSASRYGQTAKISEFLKERLLASYPEAETVVLEQGKNLGPANLDAYDAVIVGAPIYTGKFPAEAVAWVRDHQRELAKKRAAFFSVSLNAADKRLAARPEDDRLLASFLLDTGMRPQFVASIAGALPYPKYNFLLRFLMKMISKKTLGPVDTTKSYEMTDWHQVTAFAKAFAADDMQSPFAFTNRFPSGLQAYESREPQKGTGSEHAAPA